MMSLLQRIRNLARPLAPQPTDAARDLPPLVDIRAVLFDIYGTLIISGSGDIGVSMAQNNAAAFSAALRAVGLTPDAIDARRAVSCLHETIQQHHAHRRAAGVEYPEVDIRDVWADVFEAECDRRPQREVIEAFSIEYECRVNPSWPMPDMLDTLEALRCRGFALGIISNAQFFTPLLFEALADRSLNQLGFDPDRCVYSFELLEAKPSTALYEHAARALHDRDRIAPTQVLYVGNDMLNDITPARQVGFRTALFAGDRRSLRRRTDDPRVAGLRPDATLTALADLPHLLS